MTVPAVVMDPSTPFKRLGPVSRLREFITPVQDVHVLAHLLYGLSVQLAAREVWHDRQRGREPRVG